METRIRKRFASIKIGFIDISNVNTSIKKALCFFSRPSFIQLVPLSLIASEDQLLFALEQSVSAFESGEAFSANPALEFLGRALGTKQIGKAILSARFEAGKNPAALVVLCDSSEQLVKAIEFAEQELSFKESPIILTKSVKRNFEKLKKFYAVGDKELGSFSSSKEDALKNAILERVAFVSI